MVGAYREARKAGATRAAALRFQIAMYLIQGSCIVYVNLDASTKQLSDFQDNLDSIQEAISLELIRRSTVPESLSAWLQLGLSGPSMN